MVRLKVDIIVASGINSIRAAHNATKTIPIIMVGIGIDPVEAGLVESLARSGGNVTGLTNLTAELGRKRLELLKRSRSQSAPFRGSLRSGQALELWTVVFQQHQMMKRIFAPTFGTAKSVLRASTLEIFVPVNCKSKFVRDMRLL